MNRQVTHYIGDDCEPDGHRSDPRAGYLVDEQEERGDEEGQPRRERRLRGRPPLTRNAMAPPPPRSFDRSRPR